jgi:hypothetical protein
MGSTAQSSVAIAVCTDAKADRAVPTAKKRAKLIRKPKP